MRDNFSAQTKRILAHRAGHRCSNPDCGKPTSGPTQEEDGFINIGKAAHITAAAPNAPRYESSLTPEQRSDASNGIWLCPGCHDLIDQDAPRYPTTLLHQWKEQAEESAFLSLCTNRSGGYQDIATALPFDEDEADREFLSNLALPTEDDINLVMERMRAAATNDVATFRNVRNWPSHVVSLSLAIKSGDERQRVTLEGVAKGVGHAATGLTLVSSPGTGKSITLVQIAEHILTARQAVPLLIPLGEWSVRPDDFFSYITRRNAFRSFRPEHFMQLAYFGRLILLLDGWNELDPNARIRAIRTLDALRRDFPLLGTLIATRSPAPTIADTLVEIEPLSEDQQLEMARAVAGGDGEAVLEQARHTPGLRELISIPLYLHTFLTSATDTTLPATKEEVLSRFVIRHEQVPARRERLNTELHGTHTNMLVGLAVEATRATNTAIPETIARRTISREAQHLLSEGQLGTSPQPDMVLDVLVNFHVLTRSSLDGASFGFQHQQFQEWFASLWVERLMQGSNQGNTDAQQRLCREVLNWPFWEEAVLFACERLSHGDESQRRAVAKAILQALAIDPMLAAEMLYRGTPEVWLMVKDDVVSFCERWHTPGKVDRAVRFMITTGRPEFAHHIWPLILDTNDQIYIGALRAADHFRPTVLGDDSSRSRQLAALPEGVRKHVFAGIARNGGVDGMELASRLALTDPSSEVVVEVIQALDFRRAEHHVSRILTDASDEVWLRLGSAVYPEELGNPELNRRLQEARQNAADKETDPVRIVGHLIRNNRTDDGERVSELIQDSAFPVGNRWTRQVISEAFEAYPHQVVDAFLHRLSEGLDLPYNAAEFLESAEPIDEGPIVDMIVDGQLSERAAREACSVLGPVAVGRLIDRFLDLGQELERKRRSVGDAVREEFWRMRNAIRASRQASLFRALMERSATDQPKRIQSIASLLAQHGGPDNRGPLEIGPEDRDALVSMLLHWIEVMLTSPDANRHQFADVADVAGRLGDPRFVPGVQAMLARDLSDRARAREEYSRAKHKGPIPPDVVNSYTFQYRRAFAAIGGQEVAALMKRYLFDPQFCIEAACVLVDMWRRENPPSTERQFMLGHEFSKVKERRKRRLDSEDMLATCDSSEAIFAVVQALGTAESDEGAQRHALKLAEIGLGMPHGSKRTVIERLLALPQPSSSKCGLLRAMAIAGEVLPTDVLLGEIKVLLDNSEEEPWRLDPDRGELMEWLELFAFSNQPIAVLETLERVPDYGLSRLLSALSYSPSEDAVDVLVELARRRPRMLADYDWWYALVKIDTEESFLAFLNAVCESNMDSGRQGMSPWQLSGALAGMTTRFPAVRNAMTDCYERLNAGGSRDIIEAALAEIADEEIVLALFRRYVSEGRSYKGSITKAISHAAVGMRPIEGWPNAFNRFSKPLIALRKTLFEIMSEKEAGAELAEACLTDIDEQRDEYGRVENEPRHPYIESGQAWPLVVEVSESGESPQI